jgi:thiol-disulfide isomerase/thioredoxin
MLERIALVLVLVAAGVAAYALLRQLHLRRMPTVAAAGPTLLYFRSDSCAVCPAQGRYVDQLAAQWADLAIERIDAERDPDTAARYRVFSLPTTVLIDGRGQVRHVNYGLTDAHKLGRQLAQLADLAENDPQIKQIGQIFGRSNRTLPLLKSAESAKSADH